MDENKAARLGRPALSPRAPVAPVQRVKPLKDRLAAAKGQTAPVPSPNYDRFDKALAYMWKEMVTNAKGPEVQSIRNKLRMAEEMRHQPPYSVGYPGPGPQQNAAAADTLALAEFYSLVHAGAAWDHKPKLEAMLGLAGPDGRPHTKDDDYWFPVRGDARGEYHYDVWSNIHFGFVGAAAGFSLEGLQAGANAYGALTGGNTKSDDLSIKIGYELRLKYGDALTPENLHQAILAHSQEYWAIRAANKDDAAVTPPKNNR